jgi:ComF family protein
LKFFDFILQVLFPYNVSCIVHRDNDVFRYGFCEECYKKLKRTDGCRCEICLDLINTEGRCGACFSDPPDYERLYCSFVYDEPIKMPLLLLKSGKGGYLKHQFSEIALDTVPKDIMDKITLITSVPSSRLRTYKRGYNQSELIGREISKKTSIPYLNVLSRTGEAKAALLDKAERLKSIKDQFILSKNIFGETVLLVDDVCTTGATLRACAHQLKLAGAKEVYCFTVARTDKKM